MSLTPATLNTVPGADVTLSRDVEAQQTSADVPDEVTRPLPVISEHEVLIGTAAAIAGTPTFEGELEEAVAHEVAVTKRSGWIAALTRRLNHSDTQRPPRRHYPRRVDSDYIADARMAREMLRL